MPNGLSVPWWAIAVMIAGLIAFVAVIVTSVVRNRGIKRSIFAGPYALWMIIFTVVPILIIGYYALTDKNGNFTTDNLAQFWDSNFLLRKEEAARYSEREADIDGAIEEKRQQIAVKEAELAQKEEALNARREEKGIPALEAEIAELESQLYTLKAELAVADEATVAARTPEVEALEEQLAEKQKDLSKARKPLTKNYNERDRVQADLDVLREELRRLEEEGIEPYVPVPRGMVNIDAFVLSLWLAFLCTIVCLILGYPAALFMANRRMKRASGLLILFVVPMWMNITLRTLAMRVLIQDDGIILSALNALRSLAGLAPTKLNDTMEAVMIAMVYNFLPFMIFPIYTVLSKLDPAYAEASADLGASPARSFVKVTLPLSVPGIVSGITMVFMPSVTTFAINDILGGSLRDMLGNKIERVFMTDSNWNLGSAISLVMMVLILISLTILRKADPNNEGGGM